MKVSLIQMNSISDKAANFATAMRLVERAVELEKPDWILLPENFEWSGGTSADKAIAAEPLKAGSSTYDFCADLARRNRIFVHAGSVYEKIAGENRLGNTTVVFNREGREVARYAKIHLFDITAPDGTPYLESATIRPGRDIVTYDCEGLTVGCTICYDIRFPELFQALMARKADVIALPASFTMQTGKDHWEVLLRARAIETECYLLASAQCGAFDAPGGKRFTYGHTLAVDPWGHVVAKASDGEGIVSTRIDRDLIARVRRQIPLSQHKVIDVARGDTPADVAA
jgi:deaminated glutathione amidase